MQISKASLQNIATGQKRKQRLKYHDAFLFFRSNLIWIMQWSELIEMKNTKGFLEEKSYYS